MSRKVGRQKIKYLTHLAQVSMIYLGSEKAAKVSESLGIFIGSLISLSSIKNLR